MVSLVQIRKHPEYICKNAAPVPFKKLRHLPLHGHSSSSFVADSQVLNLVKPTVTPLEHL
jgi:hypothetical protein